MKRATDYLGIIAGGIMLLALGGCSATMYSSSSRITDDLYGTHDKNAIVRMEANEQAQARKAAEAATLAEARAEGEYFKSTGNPYQDVLADTYDDAYARRLRGFSSPTYRMPSSYSNFRFGDAANYASSYDPAFYNVMVMGDEVWVEPKYITSMFGSWGSPSVNINFGGGGYWGDYWGWNNPWYGWGNPYWGRPYWNSYWGWNNPWYGWGGPSWGNHYPHWGSGWYPGGGWYPGTGSGSRPNVSYRPNYRPYGNSTTSGNRYGNSSGYRPSGTTYGGGSSSSGNSGYRNRYDKSNSSSGSNNSGYRPSYGNSNSGGSSNGGSYTPPSSGGSSSGSTSSGSSSSGGSTGGGGSRSSGSRGR